MKTRAVALVPRQRGQVPGGGAEPSLAVELVVDDRDREMRLVADRLAARGDRVQPRRERPQRLHELGRSQRAG